MSCFDVKQFLLRHLKIGSWNNNRNQIYTIAELEKLLELIIIEFKKDGAFASLNAPCTIVGDLHGQFRDLLRILYSRNDNTGDNMEIGLENCSKNRFLFLGDYVDRGQNSMEVICTLYALKIIFPQQYMLLRGNHETKAINFVYGFRDEILNRMGERDGVQIWSKFNESFSWMPLAGIVGGRILCMHGGISPKLTSIECIHKIPRPLDDVSKDQLALDLLWADPIDRLNYKASESTPIFVKNIVRGMSVMFNEEAIVDVLKKLDIDLIVRAHQVQDQGFCFSRNRKMITIFSAPNYMGEHENKGAVLKVRENGNISLKIFHVIGRDGGKPKSTNFNAKSNSASVQ